jgi:hypothetical protein
MKKLGLVLMIATFMVLMIGQARASPVNILQQFTPGNIVHNGVSYQGKYDYWVTNNGNTGILFQVIIWYKNADINYDTGVITFATTELPNPTAWNNNDVNMDNYKLSANWVNWGFTGLLPGETGHFAVAVNFADGIPSVIPHQRFDSNSTVGGFSGQTHTPEPSTLLLLGFGLITVAGYTTIRKRRKKL